MILGAFLCSWKKKMARKYTWKNKQPNQQTNKMKLWIQGKPVFKT